MNKVEIFPWNDRFVTGIPDVDKQHRHLVDLLNTLVSHMAFGDTGPTISAILDELKRYAEFHFRSEEAVWKEVFAGDEWEARHEESHQQFVVEILELETQNISCSSDRMLKTLIRFLTHWLALHIIEQDMRMAKTLGAVRSGHSLTEAKKLVSEEMAGPARAMIDTVMYMYDCLADRTLQLSAEIDRRSKAEQRLIEANAELHAKSCIIEDRNVQLNAMFNLSPDGFVAFSREGRIKFVNPAFQAQTGIAPEEILGDGEDSLNLLLQKRCDLSKPYTGIKATIADMVEAPLTVDFFLSHPRRAVLRMIGISSDSASISKILYFRDVTQESTIDHMKSEFLTTAAHELRNPMASIYGFSEVLMSQDIEPIARKEIAGIIHDQSEIMVTILNELLDLARIESGKGKDFDLQRLPVQHLLDFALNSFIPPSGRDNPTLTYPKEVAYILADRDKFTQALTNVLSNAYKYSPGGGGVEISVELQSTRPGKSKLCKPMLSISVSDQGIGMSPDELERVGERFYRADRTGSIPGTGLGISIVKEIVELHGGEIKIHSELDVGTTVDLQFPLLQVAPYGEDD